MNIEDTYYLNYDEALKIAKQNNKINNNKYIHQICYFNGTQDIDNLPNLKPLPIDNIVDTLAVSILRIPSKINFNGIDISEDIQNEIKHNFYLATEKAEILKKEVAKYYRETYLQSKLDFNEKTRFFLMGNSNTEVMQYVSKNIVTALQELNYEVYYQEITGIEDNISILNEFYQFNPHVTININHLSNEFLNDDVFNFVWFQDPMPILLDDSVVRLRKRDYLYSLVNVLDSFLNRKHLPFKRQSFCVNKNIFYNNADIQRDKKIIFIGSSYLSMIPSDNNTKLLVDDIVEIFNQGESFSPEVINKLSQKFNIDKDLITTRIIPYVIRDFSVLNLCELKTPYTVEIYGNGWESYPKIKSFYHGVLDYGKKLSDVYNTATFVFAPHQNYILQQRTLEGAACGAIPILYDCREISDEKTYEEAICYFKTKAELEHILNNEKSLKKDLSNLVNDNTYHSFVNKILEVIKEQENVR